MSLTPRLWRLCLWCAQEELNARRNGKTPGVQAWNAELVRALEMEVAVSSTRQQDCDGQPNCHCEHDDWIGSVAAAQILGWNIRDVQRKSADLDGRKFAGKWRFRESAVLQYAEGLTNGRLAG